MTVPVFADRHRVAVPCGCVLGEGPVWDGRIATLHWVDIDGGALWSWRPGTGEDAVSRPVGDKVGFVQLTPDPGTVVLGLKSGIARYDVGGGPPEIVLRPEPDRPDNRLNDATTGPDGALYFGSMDDGERSRSGAFHHWSATGLASFGEAATVTNGPAIDVGRRVLYTADTGEGRIFRHALGPDGVPGPGEPFVTFRPGDGHPDGLTVDAEGHLWVCHFGGARITRFGPDGAPVLVVPMPTPQVTKIAFGGPDLRTVYATTAARGRDRTTDPLAGHLFAFDAGVQGVPADICRMPPP